MLLTRPASIATLCPRGCFYLGPDPPRGGRTVLLASPRAPRSPQPLAAGLATAPRAMGLTGRDEYVEHRAFVGRSAAEPERSDDHTGEHKKGSGGRVLSVQPHVRTGA